jgi:hypothetical protein
MSILQCATCDPDLILNLIVFIFRGVILVLCTTGGIISIYLGWRLYKDSMLSPTEGTAQFEKFTFRLVSGGPGIFFCAFGMWLLVHLADRTAQSETESQDAHPATYQRSDYLPSPTDGFTYLDEPSGLIKVGESVTQNQSPPCLITTKKNTTVLFSGKTELTPELAKQALNTAVTLLRSQINPQAQDDQLNDKISKVSLILKQLEERVEIPK